MVARAVIGMRSTLAVNPSGNRRFPVNDSSFSNTSSSITGTDTTCEIVVGPKVSVVVNEE